MNLLRGKCIEITLNLLCIVTELKKGMEHSKLLAGMFHTHVNVLTKRMPGVSIGNTFQILVEGSFCWIHEDDDYFCMRDRGGNSCRRRLRPKITNAAFTNRCLTLYP